MNKKMDYRLRERFSSLIIKIGITIILVEIVVLTAVGVFFVNRFSEAVDEQIESQVTLPSVLMDRGLLNVATLVEQDTMRQIVGETLLEGWAVDHDGNIIASFNPEHLALSIEDVEGINVRDFDFDQPQSQVFSAQDSITSITPIYRSGEDVPRLFIYVKVGTEEAIAEKTLIRNRYLLSSVLTVFATSLILIVSFRWTVFRQLTGTLAVLESVAKGDLSARIQGRISHDELGNLQGHINSTIAILETREKEREVAEAERLEYGRVLNLLSREQEWNASIQRVIKVFSHELRTPLSVIQTSTDLLTRYDDRLSSERKTEKFATITSQVQNMNNILDDVVQVVQTAFGHDNFHPGMMNLEQICRVTINELQDTIGSQHRMIFDTDGQIKTVYADEKLITRILINLLSNAIKYSPDVSEIRLILRDEDGVALSVKDEGMGISKEDRERVFDTFFRTDNVRRIRGTGLGLSIVRDCVRLHGGSISLESELGKGSTFKVSLPLKSDTDTID